MTDRVLVKRPEFVRAVEADFGGVVQKKLTFTEKLFNQAWIRKGLLLLLLAAVWQVYATILNNSLVFPTFVETLTAFVNNVLNGVLIQRGLVSVETLLMGYGAGLLMAGLLTAAAVTSRIGNDFLETLTSMFNPLPSIAILPLAMIWFGLGVTSIVFVLIHSVLWPVALNTHAGFRAVSPTLRMVGRNYGLSGPRFVAKILIPAAFPSILAGFKIGWAFAWRTLIAAELVFGVTSGSGGLGWFIY